MAADTVYPLLFSIEVEVPGPPTYDRFGNEIPGKPTWQTQRVFGWSVAQSEVERGDSILRTIDKLSVIADEPLTAAQRVRIPGDSQVWVPLGNAADYNANPWWSPGLYQIDYEKVSG